MREYVVEGMSCVHEHCECITYTTLNACSDFRDPNEPNQIANLIELYFKRSKPFNNLITLTQTQTHI